MTLSDLDWTVMTVAAAIATAVATSASVSLSVLWRLVDRERAEWVTFDGSSTWSAENAATGSDGRPTATGAIANIGRGPALAVRVAGAGCLVEVRRPELGRSGSRPHELVPALTTGETASLRVWCEPGVWDRARVVVIWTASPRLLRKRRLRSIPLSQIAARPTYYGTPPDSEVPWQTVPMPEPPGPHLQGLQPDHPPPPRRWDLPAWLQWRRALLAQ